MEGGWTKLDCAGRGQKNIGGFDVTVDFPLGMEVIKTEEELATDYCDLLLGVNAWLELVKS